MTSQDLRLISSDLLWVAFSIIQKDSEKALASLWTAQARLEKIADLVDRAEAPALEAARQAANARVIAEIEAEAAKALWP